jgi:hypothetical protein
MAIARVTTWIAGQILTAAALNAEFDNLLTNALALVSPLTGSLDFNFQQALNHKLEVQTATQGVVTAGRIYWQSSEGTIHVDTGTVIGRTPVITKLERGDVVIANAPTVSGATTYTQLRLGSAYSMMGVNAAGTQPRYRDLVAGSGIGITFADAALTFTAGVGGSVSVAGTLASPGGSTYTRTTASFADVDATNLKASVTVPVGAKFLFVMASFGITASNAIQTGGLVQILAAGTAVGACVFTSAGQAAAPVFTTYGVVANPTSGAQTIALQFRGDGANAFVILDPTTEGLNTVTQRRVKMLYLVTT